jgi:hypothetical protein
MKTLPCILSMSILMVCTASSAQEERKTDAQKDGLVGPVKSVSTLVTMSSVKWQQPGGPTIVQPVWCRDCSYDQDGNKTISGQIVDGNFLGDLIDIRRDSNGHVTDRTVTNAANGQVRVHQMVGPFGTTEETDYYSGTGNVTAQQTFSYDQYGRIHDWLSLDGDGKQLSNCITTHAKDGTLTEQSCFDKNNQPNWLQTYDPDRDLEHFTVFDESGAVRLTWTRSQGKVIAFWEQPGPHAQSQFGENFSEFEDSGNAENYSCHPIGQCDIAHVRYQYLDPAKKRNPISAEWRDADGHLVVAAYCEYELDSAGNWTHRKVWVASSEQSDRALYEEDSRTIASWQK